MANTLEKIVNGYSGLFRDPSVGIAIGGITLVGIAIIAGQAKTICNYRNQIDELIEIDEEARASLRDFRNYIEGYRDCLNGLNWCESDG